MTKVCIVPGNLGNYTNGGGSWNEDVLTEGTFLFDLSGTPRIDDAVIYHNEDNILHIGHVQSIVITASMIYVFIPVNEPLVK